MTENAADFLHQFDVAKPGVVAIDLVMPEMDGIALLKKLAERRVRARILVTSGLDVRTLSWAQDLGRELGLDVAGLIPKPVRAAELRSILSGLKGPVP